MDDGLVRDNLGGSVTVRYDRMYVHKYSQSFPALRDPCKRVGLRCYLTMTRYRSRTNVMMMTFWPKSRLALCVMFLVVLPAASSNLLSVCTHKPNDGPVAAVSQELGSSDVVSLSAGNEIGREGASISFDMVAPAANI